MSFQLLLMKIGNKYYFIPENSDRVVDAGSRGQCSECKRYPDSTAIISPFDKDRICQYCASQPEHQWRYRLSEFDPKFEPSDAKFLCPISNPGCSENQLSYEEYWIGSCCKKAGQWECPLGKYESLTIVSRIFENAREEEQEAEKEAKTAETDLEVARKTFEEAQKKAKDTKESLGQKKIWRKKVQKRHLFVSEMAMKEDNEDLEDMTFVKEEQLSDKLKCKVCLQFYSDLREETIIISCGHKFCHICLSELENMHCPACRKRFTKAKMVKVFDP